MAATFVSDVTAGIEIPEAGTLSKKVADDGVRLVVFAFDEGQELTEHRTARAAIIQVTHGRLTVTVDGAEHDARPGCWLLMEPDAPHSLVAVEPSIVLLTLLPKPAA